MRDVLIRNRASIFICCAILVVAATMMHPAFASLLSIALIAGLLILLRACAHLEGRASARDHES